MTKKCWWNKNVNDTMKILNSDARLGLSLAEAEKRKQEFSNTIPSEEKHKPLEIFLHQFTDTMVLVLLGATVVSGLVGAMVDAITIMIIVIINAILGFFQEYRAEKSLEEIKKLSSAYALVIRSGKRMKIPAEELVPGDIVLLETGDKVPADIRLLQTSSLEIDEAALTGESIPVEKDARIVCSEKTPLAEQRNMSFMGTAITRGRGSGIVVETGIGTIMGEIAKMMVETDSSLTPLQQRLSQLGKILIMICLGVCALVAGLGILRGEPAITMLLAGISLAVAAIPEGLPAIVTVVLALGIQRMAKRNAIVRKLPAVETLGCTTVICSDKTGTLTCNQMTVQKMACLDSECYLRRDELGESQTFYNASGPVDPLDNPDLRLLIDIAVHCNNSSIEFSKGRLEVQGDPTEGALLVMGSQAGVIRHREILRELPFDSERKRMSVVIEQEGKAYLYVKGALDVIIDSCNSVFKQGITQKISSANKAHIMKLQDEWASGAMRILGFARKELWAEEWKDLSIEALEKDLTLIGICGMVDPPRPGVSHAVERCLGAGIIPIMITGDHPSTAAAVAREIGISKGNRVVTGPQIDGLSDRELYACAVKDRVFARVSPQHKNRIVLVLKEHRHVVAMTGDGVNDAPAIKAADIGIAMGISGTQVTKEASSMILIDDDFSTIVEAVYEGRAIYDNIRKFIRYLLGCNIGEVLVMFIASLLGMPLPMLPIQILWVNLVTDGLPAMALGIEPPEPGIMNRKPRPRDESIFARKMGWFIFTRGAYIAIISLSAFIIGLMWSRLHGVDGFELARTMTFTTLVFAQLFYVFECRSEIYSPFELGFFKNSFLVIAVMCSVVMQILVVYAPFMQQIFKTVPLEGWQWLIILFFSGTRFLWKYILYTWQRLFVSTNDYDKMNHK